jgi:hypothetical protein
MWRAQQWHETPAIGIVVLLQLRRSRLSNDKTMHLDKSTLDRCNTAGMVHEPLERCLDNEVLATHLAEME